MQQQFHQFVVQFDSCYVLYQRTQNDGTWYLPLHVVVETPRLENIDLQKELEKLGNFQELPTDKIIARLMVSQFYHFIAILPLFVIKVVIPPPWNWVAEGEASALLWSFIDWGKVELSEITTWFSLWHELDWHPASFVK